MSLAHRKCPSCGERLSFDAERCVCGWAVKAKRSDGPAHEMTCSWTYGALRCRYPNGLFAEGVKRGFCLLHRRTPSGVVAARIAEESQAASREQYVEAAENATYGVRVNGARPDNANVAELRSRLRRVAGGGTVGILSTRLLAGMRQPGSDEGEDVPRGTSEDDRG